MYIGWPTISLTRLGHLLDFGHILSLWQQLICPNLPHSQAFCKGVKIYLFFIKITLGNFYNRHLAIFSGHTAHHLRLWLTRQSSLWWSSLFPQLVLDLRGSGCSIAKALEGSRTDWRVASTVPSQHALVRNHETTAARCLSWRPVNSLSIKASSSLVEEDKGSYQPYLVMVHHEISLLLSSIS